MDVIVTRPLSWVVRRVGAQTLLLLTLLLLALSGVALELADLVRGLEDGLSLPVVALGVLVGWMLAKSPLPGWLAGTVVLILGAEWLFVRVGGLGSPLALLLRSLATWAWEFLRWPLEGPPDGPSLAPILSELEASSNSLLIHVRDWSLAVIRGEATFDPLATALVWGLVLWLVAVWSSWGVRRRYQALQGIAPAGVLLATTLSYTWDQPLSLWTLLGVTLLLMVTTRHIARERHWQTAGVSFSNELRIDVAFAAVGLVVVLLTAAFLTPSVSVQPFFRSVRRLIWEQLSAGKQVGDILGLNPRSRPTTALEPGRRAGLPRQHLLGSGTELSEQMVMLVHVEGPHFEPSEGVSPPRYYWRAITYDRYTGRGWDTGPTEITAYEAGQIATPVTLTVRQTVRQQVQIVGDPDGLLYRAGELVTADQDYRVAWRSPGDAFGAEIESTVYRVDSSVPVLSEAQLRSAGSDYPAWVQDRFLALPDEVPKRVLSLAHDLTANEPAPYDQARAIETYLRAFTYTLDLPAPPADRDVADYFLFDLQQGYCDYYATSMVVLARASGLPARFVMGYASGTYDTEKSHYVVAEDSAHSWVEIYFPNYGWVEFEPTGGRPAIVRPAEAAIMGIPKPPPPLEPAISKRFRLSPGWLVGLGALGGLSALGLASLIWQGVDRWRLNRMPPIEAVATLYRRLYHHGRRLAVPVTAGDTPYEFEAELMGRVTALAQGRRWGATAAITNRKLHWLMNLYVRGLYSPRGPSAVERAQVVKAWPQLHRRLWLAWVWRRTQHTSEQKERQ